jgi:hypothetical protein
MPALLATEFGKVLPECVYLNSGQFAKSKFKCPDCCRSKPGLDADLEIVEHPSVTKTARHDVAAAID